VKLRPGGSLWLLRHELRLYYFRMGITKAGTARRGLSRGNLILMALALVALHGFAVFLMRPFDQDYNASALVAIGATVMLAIVFTMMVSQGLKSSIDVLFERGDLDLLLSSPLPSRSIFMVRLAAVVIGTAALYLFLMAPFANAGLILGHARALAVYPVVLGMAAVAASLSMLLTLALVRLVGIRRTRVLAQVLGALMGALIFLISQVYANSGNSAQQTLGAWIDRHTAAGAPFGPDSLLWTPGRAVLGEPLSILAIAALGLAAFFLTANFTHGFFVRGVQQAVSLVKNAAAPAGGPRYRFGRSLAVTVLLKEWRLILRDPQLISQVLLQLLYLLPLCFMLVFKASTVVPGLGASLTFLCTSLTTALAWLIIAAEDAPDLLRTAPAPPSIVAGAKLAAAVAPALVLMAAPLLWVAWRQPVSAILLALCVTGASTSAALLVRWGAVPAARGDFRRRAAGSMVSNILEWGGAMLWAGLSWVLMALAQPGQVSLWVALAGAALFVLLFVLMALAWARRQRTP